MAYDDNEKEYLKLVIHESINTSMKPVMDQLVENSLQLQRHEQMLVGADGTNGLNGDMRTIKKKILSFDVKIGWATGAAVGISTIFSLLKKNIFGG